MLESELVIYEIRHERTQLAIKIQYVDGDVVGVSVGETEGALTQNKK